MPSTFHQSSRDVCTRKKSRLALATGLYQGLLLFHEGRYFEARSCVWPRSYFSINRCLRKAVPRAPSPRAHRVQMGETAVAESETEAAVAKSERLQARRLPIRRTSSASTCAWRGDRLRLRGIWRGRVECWKLCAAACTPRAENSFREKTALQVYEALVICTERRTGDPPLRGLCLHRSGQKSRSMTEMNFQSARASP